MMFAQVESVPSEYLKNFALIILGLLGAAYYVKEIFFSKKNATEVSPQPLIVAMEKEFATKHELERLRDENRKEHENLFSKIGGVERGANGNAERKITELQHERREDVRTLHQEINEVARKVAGLESATELQNQRLAQMDSKIDRLLMEAR